jgi:hypothetical protein
MRFKKNQKVFLTSMSSESQGKSGGIVVGRAKDKGWWKVIMKDGSKYIVAEGLMRKYKDSD